MVTRVWPGMLALVLVVTGCVSDEQKLTTVSSNPFSGPTRTQSAWVKQAPPATQKVSLRVSEMGQKIMAANPRFGRKVAFLTLGVPQLEVFHRVGHLASELVGAIQQVQLAADIDPHGVEDDGAERPAVTAQRHSQHGG